MFSAESSRKHSVSVHCCEDWTNGSLCPVDSSKLTPGEEENTCDTQQASFLARAQSVFARHLVEIAARFGVTRRKIVVEVEGDGTIVKVWDPSLIDDEFAMMAEEKVLDIERLVNPPGKIVIVAVIERLGPRSTP